MQFKKRFSVLGIGNLILLRQTHTFPGGNSLTAQSCVFLVGRTVYPTEFSVAY